MINKINVKELALKVGGLLIGVAGYAVFVSPLQASHKNAPVEAPQTLGAQTQATEPVEADASPAPSGPAAAHTTPAPSSSPAAHATPTPTPTTPPATPMPSPSVSPAFMPSSVHLALGPATDPANIWGFTITVTYDAYASTPDMTPHLATAPRGMPCMTAWQPAYMKSLGNGKYEWWCNWVNAEWMGPAGDYPVTFSAKTYDETKTVSGVLHFDPNQTVRH